MIERGYEELANAIVLRAVEDWRTGGYEQRKEVERFFFSDRFSTLTKLNPNALLEKLMRE